MLRSARLVNEYHSQSGQVGVIILLIMVVLLTVGISLATRTTQELFVTQQSADSARVFNAAEAGIEQSLSTDFQTAFDATDTITGAVSTISDTDVNYSVTRQYKLETRVFEGVDVSIDLPKDGTTNNAGIIIQWSRETDCATQDPASLLASIYSYNAGTQQTTVRYRALGGCSRGDGFENSTTLSSGPYRFEFTLPLQSNDIFVRIKPIYNDTNLNITGNGWTLPVQYYNIRSEAKNRQGDETRIVEVNRTIPTAPSVMDYALFSGDTIVK